MTPFVNFADFLTDFRSRVETLEIESGDAYWISNITGNSEDEKRSAELQKRLTLLYADPNIYQYLRDLDTTVLDEDRSRQHTILLNAFTGNQLEEATIAEIVDTETRVESVYNNLRATLRGETKTNNALRDILRDSDDSELRREAWEASKEVGAAVEKDVLHLVELRNREARRLGYPNHYVMSLSLQELDQETLFALIEEMNRQIEPIWSRWKANLDQSLAVRFGIAPDMLQPWHYHDPFFQDAPPGTVNLDPYFKGKDQETLTGEFFKTIGLPVDEILKRSDLYEKEGKCQHAFCIHIGRYEDVRVLCNCTETERWMGVMLHEFGHAVYDRYLGADLPYFLRQPAHTLTTEAIAMLMGRLSRNAAWLQRYIGVEAMEAERIAESAATEGRAALLVMARWCSVMVHFERALYEDPTQDLNRLWWELVTRFQGVRAPAGRNAPDWAAKIHIALAPVYYQNYLLGEMFASQLLDHIMQNILPSGATDHELVASPAVGNYLRHAVFAPGARLPWDRTIQAATGERLQPTHFLGHL